MSSFVGSVHLSTPMMSKLVRSSVIIRDNQQQRCFSVSSKSSKLALSLSSVLLLLLLAEDDEKGFAVDAVPVGFFSCSLLVLLLLLSIVVVLKRLLSQSKSNFPGKESNGGSERWTTFNMN